jgi:AraC family transcriptional regulator
MLVEWLDRMAQALDYLENHLTETLNVEATARIACTSVFHFQRMFLILTGFTVGEYVRNRRLTLAAQELVVSREKVIEIALKYGYETPESFARAFRKLHGVAPSAARVPGVSLKGYPRLSFQITLKGEQAMNYKIVDQPAFKVVGKGIQVSSQEGFQVIPQFWSECCQGDFCAQLETVAVQNGITGQSTLGICMELVPKSDEFFYLIGVEITRGRCKSPENMVVKEIPAATWAVFESSGAIPDAIQNLTKRIYSEWFPATGYERALGIDIEVYPSGDLNTADYRSEVWVPIVKK